MCDGNESPTLDGPTSDRSAGIGVEFETSQVLFHSKGDCKKEDIDKAKGKLVDKRQGPEDTPTWKLTSDTTQSVTEFLTAEYILNGQVLKVGSGDAAKAADAVASDIVSLSSLTTVDYLDSLTMMCVSLYGTHRPKTPMMLPSRTVHATPGKS